jgi:transposase
MRTAYKCRAYPDPDQAAMLSRTFGCVRVVWNRTLAARHAWDVNAAKNILAAGLAAAAGSDPGGDACGDGVRRQGASLPQSSVKQEPLAARPGIPAL